jgi:hypothetical protein
MAPARPLTQAITAPKLTQPPEGSREPFAAFRWARATLTTQVFFFFLLCFYVVIFNERAMTRGSYNNRRVLLMYTRIELPISVGMSAST